MSESYRIHEAVGSTNRVRQRLDFRTSSCQFFVTAVSSQPVVTSELGTINNIIQVRKSDFEVFDALMVDSEKCSDMSGECRTSPVRLCGGRGPIAGTQCHLFYFFIF